MDIYCSNAGIAVGGGAEAPDTGGSGAGRCTSWRTCTRHARFFPAMLERGEGYFVGTASAAALLNHIASAPYAVTKAATLSFLEWLAITHGSRGASGVGALSPGREDADARRGGRA